jgi:hypothetical protein
MRIWQMQDGTRWSFQHYFVAWKLWDVDEAHARCLLGDWDCLNSDIAISYSILVQKLFPTSRMTNQQHILKL